MYVRLALRFIYARGSARHSNRFHLPRVYIHCCRAYRYTTLLHRCRRVIPERFFFSNSSPSQHTAPRPKVYTGITTTATGVTRRSWFSISAYICTYANIIQIVYTLYSTCYNIFYILLRITRCPAVHECRRNKFIIIYVLRSHNTRVGLAYIRW